MFSSSVRAPLAVGLLWLSASAQALYFTNPEAGDIWKTTSGKTLTWKHQAGDATVGTFILESNADASTVYIAKKVNLLNGELDWPVGVSLPSSTDEYLIHIVDASNIDKTYSTVGPFEIQAFASANAPSSSTSTKRKSTTSIAKNPATSAATTTRSKAKSSSKASSSAAAATTTTSSSASPLATVVADSSSTTSTVATTPPSAAAAASSTSLTTLVTASASDASSAASTTVSTATGTAPTVYASVAASSAQTSAAESRVARSWLSMVAGVAGAIAVGATLL